MSLTRARTMPSPTLPAPVGALLLVALGGCASLSPGGASPVLYEGGSLVALADGGQVALLADGGVVPVFSFFVTSLAALQRLSGSQSGFGGDLRFGETGSGAGLRGADKLCATIAEGSLTGASLKPWRAFLSVAKGDDGAQVNAIDRIGPGPWFDRLGRRFALERADLLSDRPTSADSAIKNDFPNEDGVPNHAPSGSSAVDNHDMLTGSNASGALYGATSTCADWTGNTGAEGKPRVGHSWPRSSGASGGGGPGPGGSDDPNNWMSALDEAGCAPGVNLVEMGAPLPNTNTVGSGGGYGGFYCFALVP